MRNKFGFVTLSLLSMVMASCSGVAIEEKKTSNGVESTSSVTSKSADATTPSSEVSSSLTNTKTSPAEGRTITWKNYDGTVLETDTNVLTGTMPSYDGNTPTKPSDDRYDYAFSGWTPRVSIVSTDAVYTATFDATPKHSHIYNKDPDTLEYVCECGEKNGRDYELDITLPELHVGDLFEPRNYVYSFKNDDDALAFGYVVYRVGEEIIAKNSSTDGDYYYPSSLLGQPVEAYVYVGVYDETNIEYSGTGNDITLANVDVYVNGEKADKAGRVSHDYWQGVISPDLPTSWFFVYECCDLGVLLPNY